MESAESDNDLSNPLFEKDLFGESGADNGISDDNLMDDLSFDAGDAGLDPPFQEELENFLEATGFQETIEPPLTDVAGEESNPSFSTSQTEDEPMQTEGDENVPSTGSNEEHSTVEETNENPTHTPDVEDDKETESEENANTSTKQDVEMMESDDVENVTSESKTSSEEKTEMVEEVEKTEEKVDEVDKNEEKVEEVKKNEGKVEEVGKDEEKIEEVGKDEEKVEEVGKDEEKVEELGKDEEKIEELGKDEEKAEELGKDEEKAEELGKDEEKIEEVGTNEEKAETVEKLGKSEEKSEVQEGNEDSKNNEMEDDCKTTSNLKEEKNEGKEKGNEKDSDKQSETKDEKEDKSNDTKTKKDKKDAKKSESKAPKDLGHHWRVVNKNPTDFTSWSYLLHYVETEGHLPSARKAYKEFFGRYPYCYGYWKKYADLEKKSGNMDEAKEVFEQGLRAIPLSVELWIHFINFTMHATKDDEDRVETIRKLFEQAIEAAGTDFKSDKLWDMYIKFEKEQKDLKQLTHIYDRLIRIPTQLYSHHFEKFKKHLTSQPIKDVLSDAEYNKLRSEFHDEIEAELEASMKEEDAAADIPGGDVAPPGLDDGPPGVGDEPPGVSSAPPGEQPKKSTGVSYIKEMKNESDQIKEKVLSSRHAIHQETEQEVSKRWAFEEAIKRPYFHVKPLEKSQLKNWIEYLDFEIAEGMLERVVILFERCLIACALYEDLWLKYAKFMEPHSKEAVHSVYTRACTTHLPAKLNIVSHWAAFEETEGNYEKTREILEDLEKRHPKSTLVTLRLINFERRIKCHDKALEVFKRILAKSEKNKKQFIFFSCKLARYHYKILGEFDKAKEVLNEALKKDQDNPMLYLQLLDLEFQRSPPDENNVMQLFQQVQKSGLDAETKFLFSQRRLEFLLDYGEDVNQLLQVIGENQKLWKSQQSALKKRAASESTAVDVTPPEKKAKSDTKTAGAGDSGADATTAQPTNPAQQQQQYQQQYQQQPMQPGRPPQHMMQPPHNQQGYNYGAWNQYNQPPHNAYNYQQWGGYNQGYY